MACGCVRVIVLVSSFTIYDYFLSFPAEFIFGSLFLILLPLFALKTFDDTKVYFSLLAILFISSLFLVGANFGVFGLVANNHSIFFSKIAITLGFFLIMIVDYFCVKSKKSVLILLGFSYLAMLLTLSAFDWFFLFLSIEMLTLSSYCLIGLSKTRVALEAVLKYFAMGATSTCIVLFSIFVLFISTDSTSFLAYPNTGEGALFFTTLIVSSFLLKLGAAPFHYWVVDAYEGSPSIVVVFFAVVVKLCIFLLFCRLLFNPLSEGISLWRPIILCCSAFSILLGCFGALFQKKIKRLLAYSSINNIGYILAGVSIGNVSGLQASLLYFFFYCLSLSFVFILILGPFNSKPLTYIVELQKLRSSYAGSVTLALLLFSMAGIPPLSGFWIKFFILYELISAKLYILAVVGAFASIISSFYYVSLIKILYFERTSFQNKTFNFPSYLSILPVLTLFAYPLFPQMLNQVSENMALSFFIEFL